jgi:response regulator RpfG family c-di-GMP phosphodiesterase
MLQKLKSQYPEAVRILFTGYADINSVIAAINQGHVYRYLSKPWQPEELEIALDDAAAEYARIVTHVEELKKCHEKTVFLDASLGALQESMSHMESQIHDLQSRTTQLEQENAELRQLLERQEP